MALHVSVHEVCSRSDLELSVASLRDHLYCLDFGVSLCLIFSCTHLELKVLICLYELGLYCTIPVALVACLVIGHLCSSTFGYLAFPWYMHVCLCVLLHMCMWRLEDGIGCLPQPLPENYLAKTSLPLNLEITYSFGLFSKPQKSAHQLCSRSGIMGVYCFTDRANSRALILKPFSKFWRGCFSFLMKL